MKKFKALLLDFDGTLADTEKIKDAALNAYFQKFNIPKTERVHGESSSRIIIKAFKKHFLNFFL